MAKKRIPGRARPGNSNARKHPVEQDAHIGLKSTTAEKQFIIQAAEKKGETMGPFVLRGALELAKKVMREEKPE